MKHLSSVLVAAALTLPTQAAMADPGHSHHGQGSAHNHAHGHANDAFSAGEPGNPKRSSRIVQVTMRESDGKMVFIPERVEVKRGEQIRFVLRNNGVLEHEFVLATRDENLKHAEAMKKNPEMEHADPNAKRLQPAKSSEIVWRFTKAGEFEYGCLIPGHREAGMIGTVIVK